MISSNNPDDSNIFYEIYQALPTPTYIWQTKEADFELIAVNKAAAQSEEIKGNHLLGEKASTLFKDEPDIISDLHHCLQNKSSFQHEVKVHPNTSEAPSFSMLKFTYVNPQIILLQKEESIINEYTAKINAQLEDLLNAKKINEARLVEAQRAAKVGNWETDLATLKVHWSEQTYTIFELDSGTFKPTHHSFLEMVHPEDKQRVDEAFVQSFNSKEYNTIEHRILTKNGHVKYVEERWKVNFNEQNETISVFGTCQDITDRKLIEFELHRAIVQAEENEHRLRLAAEGAQMGIWDWNVQDNILNWDERMYTIYDKPFTAQSNEFETWVNCLHPEDKARAMQESKAALNEDQKYDSTFRIIRPDGQISFIKADGIVIKDKNGAPIRMIGMNRDITEKIEAENNIRDKEHKYTTLFETSVDAIIVYKDGKWVDCNSSAMKLFGATRDQIIGATAAKFSTPYQLNGHSSKEESFRRIRLTLAGEPQFFEWEHIKADGTPFTAEVKLNAIELAGEPYVQVILRDITEQKTADAKLQEYLHYFQNSNDFLNVANTEGHLEIVNQQMIRVLGYTEEEFLQNEYLRIIHPEDIEATKAKLEQLKQGKPIENFQIRLRKKDGHYIWIEWNVALNGTSGKMYCIGRDITERKKFQEQLALTSLIVNASNDAIVSISNNGNISSWNSGAEKIFGYTAREIIGKSIYTIIPPELHDEEVQLDKKLKNKAIIDHFETIRLNKNKERINVSLNVSPIINEYGNVISTSTIIRDITKQKNIEIERTKVMNDLIQRSRDLEQFSYIISHNLRAPVANIIGINNIMSNQDITPIVKDQLFHSLGEAVGAMDVVIKDLNHILQIRNEHNEHKTFVKFSDLFNEIMKSINHLVLKEKVTFVTDFHEIDKMFTTKSYLYSIFHNLITNSIKYKQPDLNPIIEIKSKIVDKKILLTFKDNGLGIDLKNKGNQIFGLYKRFHFHVEGKGMGLYMVKSQVEKLGGKISLKSTLNEGTEFRIEFD